MKKKSAEKRLIDPWSKGKLKPMDLSAIASRPGSMDILNKPSRIANTLFYPDGTTSKINK